jgi:hypothetical protein
LRQNLLKARPFQGQLDVSNTSARCEAIFPHVDRIHQTPKVSPAMAAGVTSAFENLVILLTCWKLGNKSHGPHGMSTKVQYYLERAEHCERMAVLSSDREVRANFAELAQQWRDLARQHQDLGDPPPQSN